MSEHVYKTIELTGSSKAGYQQAIENAIDRASKTVKQMRWFQVMDTRGYIDGGSIEYWQVTIKVGFTISD